MNLLDILFVVILAGSLIRGLFRGLVLELSAIIGVLAGLFAASNYYPAVAPLLSGWVTDTAHLNIISMICIFFVIYILVGLLGRLIRLILRIAFMGWFDRLSGAGFGILKGCLIASVLLFTLTAFLPRDASVLENSRLSPYISEISGQLSQLVPPGINRSYRDNINGVRQTWKDRR